MAKLLYTKAECEFYQTALGFTYCVGIEQYNNAVLRGKVVLRIKMAKLLCRRYYLSEELVDKYSDTLMLVLTGVINVNEIPGYLKNFYDSDVRFRRYLASVYYTKYSTIGGDPTFLGLVAIELMMNLRNEIAEFNASTKGSYSVIYSGSTGTDLYIAIDESLPQKVEINSKYEVEVVSSAKNWVGSIQIVD